MTPQREEAERFMRLARRDEAAFRALLASAAVDFPVACFHAQQSVEKALTVKFAVIRVSNGAVPHPRPFSRREKGVKPLSLRERGWGEGASVYPRLLS